MSCWSQLLAHMRQTNSASASPVPGPYRTFVRPPATSQFDPMYGPAVSQEVFVELAVSGLASMYPASGWSSLGSGPSWKSARLRSHYRTGLSGPFGSPVFADAGKTDPPSRLILSQTSAGNPVTSAWAPSCAERSSRLDSRLSKLARLETAAIGENAPGDAGQLVGERDR